MFVNPCFISANNYLQLPESPKKLESNSEEDKIESTDECSKIKKNASDDVTNEDILDIKETDTLEKESTPEKKSKKNAPKKMHNFFSKYSRIQIFLKDY